MNNKELLDKLREGVGSQKLDEEVAKALWLEEQLNGVPLGVTTSLDATESLMHEKFCDITERHEIFNEENWWSISAVAIYRNIGMYRPVNSDRIEGHDAHACARCIVLLKALPPDGEYR